LGYSGTDVCVDWQYKPRMRYDTIMKTLHEEFEIVNKNYFDNQKDGVVLTYFPYLTDSELETLSNWIWNFSDIVNWYRNTYERDIIINTYLGDTQISYPYMPGEWNDKLSYREKAAFTKAFQQAMLQWRASLPRSERSLVDKLIRKGFDVFEPKNLLLLNLISKGSGPALGFANKNQVWFQAMYRDDID
jgi:hypothetical protein